LEKWTMASRLWYG